MQWKDFFYFSHGERRALTLLLFLLTAAWILLNFPQMFNSGKEDTVSFTPDTIIGTGTPEKPPIATPPMSTPPQKRTASTSTRQAGKNVYTKQEKFATGTVVELNSADTTILKKVPGIGSTFANRIIKYRNLLGGFYKVEQLKEVYGIDEEKFSNLRTWFCVNPDLIQQLEVNNLSREEIQKHPYVSFKQAQTIIQLRQQKKQLTGWEHFLLLPEFPEEEIQRLTPYISFREYTVYQVLSIGHADGTSRFIGKRRRAQMNADIYFSNRNYLFPHLMRDRRRSNLIFN